MRTSLIRQRLHQNKAARIACLYHPTTMMPAHAAKAGFDAIWLDLHGAMVADGYDDCEGDLLARVRAIVGPEVPVGAELDPHCHLTETMTKSADALICFKESPHTDYLERGEELVDIIADCARKKIKPVTSVYDCRMMQFMPTVDEPMRSFVDKVKMLEGKDGVLSISIVHGYTLGDVADLGHLRSPSRGVRRALRAARANRPPDDQFPRTRSQMPGGPDPQRGAENADPGGVVELLRLWRDQRLAGRAGALGPV